VRQKDRATSESPAEITPAEALAYELKVKDVMTRDVLTVAPGDRIAQLAELLQEEQISGAPVVAEGKLIGIVSVKDLVSALLKSDLDAPVSQYMTSCLHTVREDDVLVRALEVFAQTLVGRLPVIDQDGRLVGILTKGDVAGGLLKALQADHDTEEMRRYRASHLFEDIVSDRSSLILRYRVQPRDFANGGMASAHVRMALLRLGASLAVARRTGIAVYEAEMNLVIHTVNGGVLRVEVQPHAIFVEVLDDGPGIADIELAMQPGYTTASEEIRALGFGAGFGLKNIKRSVDKMWLESTPGEGTRLEMWIYLQPGAEHRTLDTVFERLSFRG
jgi:CBS domain-containing protein/anti-sigma regulatory factor (Ser/Thr protein kinase)